MGVKEPNMQVEFASYDQMVADAHAAKEKLAKSVRGINENETRVIDAYIAARERQREIFTSHVLAAGNEGGRIAKGATDHQVYETAQKKAIADFDKTFVAEFETPKNTSPEEQKRIDDNQKAKRRLEKAISGGSWWDRIAGLVYDDEQGKVKWAGIGGGLLAGIVGFFMGNYISGAGGGGTAGFLATVGLTLAAGAMGATLLESLVNPEKPATPPSAKTEENTTEGKTISQAKTLDGKGAVQEKPTDGQLTTPSNADLGRLTPTASIPANNSAQTSGPQPQAKK